MSKIKALNLLNDMIFELEESIKNQQNRSKSVPSSLVNNTTGNDNSSTVESSSASVLPVVQDIINNKNSGKESKQKVPKQNTKETLSASNTTTTTDATSIQVDAIELRVGVITECHKHETADKLYCEKIDVGESEPRDIASGLVAHYSVEEMIGRKVIVVANLTPRKLVGFKSHGMVLCAVQSDGDHEIVEFLTPPEGSKPGDRISAEGFFGEPLSAKQCEKKHAWEIIAPDFNVKDNIGYWKDLKLVDQNGSACSSSKVVSGALR